MPLNDIYMTNNLPTEIYGQDYCFELGNACRFVKQIGKNEFQCTRFSQTQLDCVEIQDHRFAFMGLQIRRVLRSEECLRYEHLLKENNQKK